MRKGVRGAWGSFKGEDMGGVGGTKGEDDVIMLTEILSSL